MTARGNHPVGAFLIRYGPAFLAILAAAIGALSFLGWWLGDEWRHNYANMAVLNGAYISIILMLIWIMITQSPPKFLNIPNIRSILDDQIIIVDPSPWLGLGVMTAIYVMEDDFERLICIGEVINVQSNDLVQIKIRIIGEPYSEMDDIMKKLKGTSKKEILIRPGLYRGYAQ